jgi:hypothetical protein
MRRRFSLFVFASSASFLAAACVADLPEIGSDAGASGDAAVLDATPHQSDGQSDALAAETGDDAASPVDAGTDSTTPLDASDDVATLGDGSLDAHVDAPIDAPVDAPADAPIDAAVDAPIDSPVDAAADVIDSGGDASIVDAGIDTGIDAGADASPITCVPKPAGLISFFTADDDALDHGPAGSDLLWVGTPAYAPAAVGDGFNLSNLLALHRLTPSGLDGLTELTIELWINPTQVLGANMVNRSATAKGWNFFIKDGALRFDMAPGTITYSNSLLQAGALTHVAMTFDGKIVSMFINGKLDAQKAWSLDGGPLPVPADGELRVGAAPGTKATFVGLLDELTFYSRALSEPEIAAIHHAGGHGKCRQ